MDFQLYSDVVLVRDVADEGLFAGDVGVVVEHHEVAGLETGDSVEFFDMLGNTIAAVTLPASFFRQPTQADRPAVHSQLVTV